MVNTEIISVVKSETSLMAADGSALPLRHKMNSTWGKIYLNILLNTDLIIWVHEVLDLWFFSQP